MGLVALFEAIVKQAADDYVEAKCAMNNYDFTRISEQDAIAAIEDCEKFFSGNMIKSYTGTFDGLALKSKLDEEMDTYRYDYDKIMESRGRKEEA